MLFLGLDVEAIILMQQGNINPELRYLGFLFGSSYMGKLALAFTALFDPFLTSACSLHRLTITCLCPLVVAAWLSQGESDGLDDPLGKIPRQVASYSQ